MYIDAPACEANQEPEGVSDISTAVIWSEDFLSYRWAHTHPMNPVRLALTMTLAQSLEVLDGIETVPPKSIDDDALTVVHTRDYIDAVRAVGSGTASLSGPLLERLFGLGDADNPVFAGMHEAARLLVGGTLAAAQAVATGAATRAVNICGGMHHAMKARAAGPPSTTTAPSPSGTCSTRVSTASPTSTSTPTTVNGCRWSSPPTRA